MILWPLVIVPYLHRSRKKGESAQSWKPNFWTWWIIGTVTAFMIRRITQSLYVYAYKGSNMAEWVTSTDYAFYNQDLYFYVCWPMVGVLVW